MRLVRVVLVCLFVAACDSSSDAGGGAGASGGVGATSGTGGDGAGSSGAGAGESGAGAGGTTGTGSSGAGAGGDTASGTGGTSGAGAGGTGGTAATIECMPIVDGTSTVIVDGVARTFDVKLPNDTSTMALLFLWHGWLQIPAEFSSTIVYDVPLGEWIPFDPNAFPMPLMIVTPHDKKLIPPVGLDWDIVSGAMDFPYFDAMLQCIQEQFTIDGSRMYSFGFSAGAVFTNLLTAQYPGLFAATISESGAWFNDMNQWSDITIPLIQWQWPAFDPADGGNVLLTHGGSNDFATVISLESANTKARPFLLENGRTVIDCAHTFGHTLDPDLTQAMYYDYLWAHQAGGPPITALPAGFPTPAQPVGATSCTFHAP